MSISEYISKKKIENRILEMAQEISKDFQGEEVMIVGVLTGSFIFCADLVRQVNLPIEVEFLSASSYGGEKVSSGNVKINLDIKRDISGKNVILVEDIVDTGLTVLNLKKMLLSRNPKSFKVASLLYKPSRLEHQEIKIDYLGFEIEDKFVVGYGLDYDGKYRQLPYIGIFSE